MPDIPKIKKVTEIGSTPWSLINIEEKILQGWDSRAKKLLYLFKDQLGVWSYYDKYSKLTVEVMEWREKEALIKDQWIKMSVYYRLHLRFAEVVTYSTFQYGAGSQHHQTTEALVLVPKSIYDQLMEVMGVHPVGWYRFEYKRLKKGDSVSKIVFVQ